MTAVASYVPGGWVAVSAPGAWLLVALPPDHPIVLRCWDLMSGDTQVEDILDALVSDGIRATADFAFACATGRRRVLARGAASILVTDSVGTVQLKVAAAPSTVWAEESFDESVDLLLLTSGTEPAADIELPMASGVTMASSIRIHLHGTAFSALPGKHPEAVTGPDEEAVAGPAASVRPAGAPVEGGRPLGERHDRRAAIASQAEDPDPDDPGHSYDFLFGATQHPPGIEVAAAADGRANDPAPDAPAADGQAADRPAADDAVRDPGLTAGWSTMAPPDPLLAEDSAVMNEETAGPGIIDAVPWLVRDSAAEPASVASVVPLAPGHARPEPPTGDERRTGQPAPPDVAQTVDRAALLAQAPPVGPTVLAGYCPAGHLSPPYAATCRVCQAPMPTGQPGFEIARPPLGVIRLADGGSVALDRGVLFGRAPATNADSEERPHLVRLVSPENDVSRNHAQIVIDGWHVYVKDLGSTNGTVVTLPGRAPVRLRPEDLQLLEHGSHITLADEVTVTFEVTA
jgi:hypothetical protein